MVLLIHVCMDVHFLPIIYKPSEPKDIENLINILPKKIGLVFTIQFKEYANIIKEKLENAGIEVVIGKSPFIETAGQVLGCDPLAANVEADTIVYIGEGLFHPKEIKRRFPNKRVIKYSPISGEILEIKEDGNFIKKIEILRYKFENSKNIGIITTIKPGQYMLNDALKTKEILERAGKNVYLFIGDNINLDEINNFPFIDFWLIYACPRLIDDVIERGIPGLTINYVKELILKLKDKKVNSEE